MSDRTAPFARIRQSAFNKVTDQTGQNITHHVIIPGLKNSKGEPLVVAVTYTVHEVAEEWASFIVDYQFDSDPVVYGTHPLAVGPLREILPAAYELPDYPANMDTARRQLRDMLRRHNLGGYIVTGDAEGRTLEYHPNDTTTDDPDYRNATITALVREYVPFRADVWWDEAHNVVRIRPPRSEVRHVVRTA